MSSKDSLAILTGKMVPDPSGDGSSGGMWLSECLAAEAEPFRKTFNIQVLRNRRYKRARLT